MIKAAGSYAASKEASARMIMEAGDGAHTSTMYGHYIRCLPREVLVRILDQMLVSIQGVNVQQWPQIAHGRLEPVQHLLNLSLD